MRLLIYGFNVACSNIAASYLKVVDESMNAIRFHTTSEENLPHFYYIVCKQDQLGTDFKTVACSVTVSLIFLDIHRGK